MSIREIGCCGAYCRTCLTSVEVGVCRGCKLGYKDGERDINKSKCKIKICCFRDRQFETCADCDEYLSCEIIQSLYNKNGINTRNTNNQLISLEKMGTPSL
jgi:hypothetical protein